MLASTNAVNGAASDVLSGHIAGVFARCFTTADCLLVDIALTHSRCGVMRTVLAAVQHEKVLSVVACLCD